MDAYGQGRLTKITQRTGDTIAVARGSIMHTNAAGQLTRQVSFQRDASGRIVSIVDPNSTTNTPTVKYEYDFSGNLVRVSKLKDRTAQTYETTTYLYGNPNFPHYITGIVDPRGVQLARSEFDETGRLRASYDAFGNSMRYLHDTTNHIETIIDQLGHGSTNYYDDHGNITATVNSLGQTHRSVYDSNNRLLISTDPLGHTNSYGYDANGFRNATTNALGEVTLLNFDAFGQLLSKTDALTNTISFGYDSKGHRVAVVDALGHGNLFGHDVFGRPTAVTNALGQLKAMAGSGSLGDLQFVSQPGGIRMDFAHDLNGNTTNTSFGWVNPVNGLTQTLATITEFDAAGRITRVTDADNQSRSTLFDADGRIQQSVGRMGETNSYLYDAMGNVIQTTYPDGAITRSVYDARYQVIYTVDRHLPGLSANGSHSVYDALGRAIRIERLANVQIDLVQTGNLASSVLTAAGSVLSSSSTVYDAGGRLQFTTNAVGLVTETIYDAAGRQTAVLVALTNRTDFIYDAGGRLRFSTNSLGHLTQHEYDAKGRKIKTIFPDDSYTTNRYDEIGRLLTVRDPMGRTTDMEYNALGRMQAVVLPQVFDPEGGTNSRPRYDYEYDSHGNLTVSRDPKGRETKSTYDALGQLISRKLPLQQTNFHAYNALGQLAVAVDFKGQSNRYVYDALGRVATNLFYAAGATVPGRTNAFEYEPGGRYQRFIRPEGMTEMDRNIDGAVTNILSAEGRITYDHNVAAGWLKRACTTNSDIRYDYDGLGRLKTVSVCKRNGTNLPAPEVTTNSYTRLGSLETVYFPNGTRTLYDYNRLTHLTNMAHYNSAGQLLARYAYTVASDGQRLAATEMHRETGGTYSTNWLSWSNDALRRLLKEVSRSTVTALNYTNSYIYDLVGNRLWKTNVSAAGTQVTGYTYNANDQLLTDGDFTSFYDANGSVTNRSSATETNLFTYSLEGRLASATIKRPSETQTIGYFYNQSGIRTRKEMSGAVNGTNIFLNDPQNLSGFSQVLEELPSPGGTPTVSYTLGNRVISQEKSGMVSYLMPDGHGSTRLLTGSDGTITDRYSYDSYGNGLNFTVSILSPPTTKLLYTSEQYDVDLQQYYLRARHYDPAAGHFGCRDTAEGTTRDPLTLHKYAYTQNNPINMVDPSGKSSLGEVSMATTISVQLQRDYIKVVGRQGYVSSKKVTELGISRESILDSASRNASPSADSAAIIVHGVSHKESGWTQLPDPSTGTSFQEKLTLPLGDTRIPGVTGAALNQDFYEFNWGGFSIGGLGAIPVKSVHQMALVHLEMAQFLVWMNGYANIDLISHSWGTTLAYDLQNTSGIEVRHWVTMGSPLKFTTPKPSSNTGNWINLYDVNDPIVHLEMFPPFPDVDGLPLPASFTGSGLTINPSVSPGQNKAYNFGFSQTHPWVHSDYWINSGVASDLRLWLP